MKPLPSLVGQKFGMLTAVERVSDSHNTSYRCRCDCGGERIVRAYFLKTGKVTDCGCKKQRKSGKAMIDLTGMRYGKLTVIHQAESRPGEHGAWWLCRCDCGKEKEIRSKNLRSGATKSCGCEMGKHSHGLNVDLTGQKFGLLTVIQRAENQHGSVAYLCKCTCGTQKVFLRQNLISGAVKHCGCQKFYLPPSENTNTGAWSCGKCRYGMKFAGDYGCGHLAITGQRRPCPAPINTGKCTAYMKRKKGERVVFLF